MDAARTGMGRACWERRTRRAGKAGGQRPRGGQSALRRAGPGDRGYGKGRARCLGQARERGPRAG